MKEIHFCMLEGKMRDYIHFSHFLLVGLGNNEKTLLSGALFKHECSSYSFIQSHNAVGFLLNFWLRPREISTTGPGRGDFCTSPTCTLFALVLCSPLLLATGRSLQARQLDRVPKPQ